MKRITEPELMNGEAQTQAYAQADFDEPHKLFIKKFKEEFQDIEVTGHVLDLGCGPADVSIRFAQAYPKCVIEALDGAPRMLEHGKLAIHKAGLMDRIYLVLGRLPGARLTRDNYSVIISNSLLHHLHKPDILWESIKRLGAPGCLVFIMDLMRPESVKHARELVDLYASGEPKVLREDFYHSLCAAFLPGEIELQLELSGLTHLKIKVISDRHLTVFGTL